MYLDVHPRRFRSRWPVWLGLVISVALSSCVSSDPNRVDPRDHAFDTYFPAADQTDHAQQRARVWWQRHQNRFGSQPPYLAVQTNLLLQGEIVQNLWAKLINSQTTANFFAKGTEDYPEEEFYGVVIYDTRTGRVVSPQGYAVSDTPPRGSVTRFGPYIARYIGTGK